MGCHRIAQSNPANYLAAKQWNVVPRLRQLWQTIDFHESDTTRVVDTPQNRSVIARRKRDDNCGLETIRRRKADGLNLCSLRVRPIVIVPDNGSVPVMEFKSRIL
jgi:hypothetical protein